MLAAEKAGNSPDEVRLVSIRNCLEHLDTIIAWHREEWGDDWAAYAAQATNPDGLPTMFVALCDGQPIGTSFLTIEDLPTRNDISPWLAGVYVRKDWRGAGVGTLLVTHAMQKAKVLGLPELFLFVHHAGLQKFYGDLGWGFVEQEVLHGDPVFIMRWLPGGAVSVRTPFLSATKTTQSQPCQPRR